MATGTSAACGHEPSSCAPQPHRVNDAGPMRAPADSRDTPKDRRVTVECRVRLPDGAECAGVARAVVRKAPADWGLPHLRDDAALAASGLAADAVIHGSAPVGLYLTLE